MKTLHVQSMMAFLALMLLTGVACQKSNPDIMQKVEHSELRAVLLKLPKAKQRNYFKTLTPKQMAGVWQQKLAQVIQLEGWTKPQYELLRQLNDQVAPGLYQENSAAQQHFFEQFEPTWRTAALQHFRVSVLRAIVLSVAYLDRESLIQRVIELDMDVPVDDFECSCSERSDWCWSPQKCDGRCRLGSNPGCGTLWAYPCDGVCVR